MRVPTSPALSSALALSLSIVVASQEAVDLGVIDRIKREASARSEVMETLRNLTDVHGPRLTGSPKFEQAAKWASDRLASYGVSNVRIERWGPFGRSWSVEQYSAELIAPVYARLQVMPLAWTASTPGPITGEPLLAPLKLSFGQGPKRMAADFEAYRKQWTGKLRGRIVLMTPAQATPPRQAPPFTRRSDEELAKIAIAPEPAALQRVTTIDDLEWPDQPDALMQLFMSLPESLFDHDRSLRRAHARA